MFTASQALNIFTYGGILLSTKDDLEQAFISKMLSAKVQSLVFVESAILNYP